MRLRRKRKMQQHIARNEAWAKRFERPGAKVPGSIHMSDMPKIQLLPKTGISLREATAAIQRLNEILTR